MALAHNHVPKRMFAFRMCRNCNRMFLRRLDDRIGFEYRDCPDCRAVSDDSVVEDPLKTADISLVPTMLPRDYHGLSMALNGETNYRRDEKLKEHQDPTKLDPTDEEREQAYERWGDQCAIDGCIWTNKAHKKKHGSVLYIHHNVPRNVFLTREAANQWSNLIPVCCHDHGEFDKYQYTGPPGVRRKGTYGFPTENPHEIYQTLNIK